MTHADRPFARLVLSDKTGMPLDCWLDIAEECLIALEGAAIPRRIASKAAVLGHTHGIRLRPEAQRSNGASMHIEVVTRDPDGLYDPIAARLLSDMVHVALMRVDCLRIEWEKQGSMISPKEFASLRTLAGFAHPSKPGVRSARSRGVAAVLDNLGRKGLATWQGIMIVLRRAGRHKAPLMAAAPVLALAMALSLTQGAEQMATLILP